MITIGKTYLTQENLTTRLCSDIVIDSNITHTLWYAITSSQQKYLSLNRADAFILALLPTAMRDCHDITCNDPISEQLYHQLVTYYIPALASVDPTLHQVKIILHETAKHYPNAGAVGTIFSESAALQTIHSHIQNHEYPLTHIAVFNDGIFENTTEFQNNCQQACLLAADSNLQTVYLDTNLGKILNENIQSVRTFRHISCILALQGLFSVCIFPSKYNAASFKLDLKCSRRYDLLTINCVSTESLSFYLSGAETNRLNRQRSSSASLTGHTENTTERQKIIVAPPSLENILSGDTRLSAQVTISGQSHTLWFAVKKEYGTYLTNDRADAFVAVLLTTAMRNGADIICQAPVTRRLLYQLNNYFIPILASSIAEYHHITIYAEPTDIVLECANAVGTGWTGGVDSMFTYMENLRAAKSRKITHLLIANNGAIEGDSPCDTLEKMVQKTTNGFASETGLAVIGVNTNFGEVLPEKFIDIVRFRHAAVVLALQNLFSIFYISSCAASFKIRLDAGDDYGYEFLTLVNFSTNATLFQSSGGAYSRIQKLEKLSDFLPAHKYLHPCIYALKDNCGTCGKCACTLAALYSLGTLERFSTVFDIKQFKKNKNKYLAEAVINRNIIDFRCYNTIYMLLKKQKVNLFCAKITACKIIALKYLKNLLASFRL